MDQSVLQEIRKSHCARKGEEHKCAGSCKITPKGIELSCPICGDDKNDLWAYDKKYLMRAKQICKVIGLEFDNMDFEVRGKILKEIMKDYCPNCNATHFHLKDYMLCSCGWTYSEYNGWKGRKSINSEKHETTR